MKKEKKSVTIRFRCTKEEKEIIVKESNSFKSMTDYMHRRIFRSGASIVNPVELIRLLDEIVAEMGRIGNNMNQLARHVNRTGFMSEPMSSMYVGLLREYILEERELNKLFRKIISL